MDITVDLRWQKKQSVNLKADQQKLPNPKNRKKTGEKRTQPQRQVVKQSIPTYI